MNSKLYYQAPAIELFDDVRENAIKIWQSYDNTYGYADEKINQIVDMQNVGDNFMYIVAMFDYNNQEQLASMLKEETKKAIHDRIMDGGGFDVTFTPRSIR